MSERIQIEGIAIVEGISRNGMKYTAQELHKFAPSLTGRPILKDHESKTDNVIGLVELGESIDGGKKVRYKGWIKDSATIEKIKDKRIKEVSIGAVSGRVVKESEDSDVMIPKDMVALELSTTPTPGVVGTTLAQTEYLDSTIDSAISESLMDREIEKLNHIQVNIENTRCKEVIMESEKNTENVKVDESIELRSKLQEANKVIEGLKESQRQDAIAGYDAVCKVKGLKAVDCKEKSLETIKALREMADSADDAEEEKSEEAPVVEPVTEEKVKSQPRSQEFVASEKVSEDFGGYVLERSSLGGWALYKSQ